MPNDAPHPRFLRLRRALLATVIGVAGAAGLAACADDTTEDIDEGPGGGAPEQNVPLPPGDDTSDDDGPSGEVDGERPGLGGDADPDQGDFLEDDELNE